MYSAGHNAVSGPRLPSSIQKTPSAGCSMPYGCVRRARPGELRRMVALFDASSRPDPPCAGAAHTKQIVPNPESSERVRRSFLGGPPFVPYGNGAGALASLNVEVRRGWQGKLHRTIAPTSPTPRGWWSGARGARRPTGAPVCSISTGHAAGGPRVKGLEGLFRCPARRSRARRRIRILPRFLRSGSGMWRSSLTRRGVSGPIG